MQSVGRKVGFYIRVSTDRQAKVQEGSLKNQRQILDAELNRRNLQQPDWGVFADAYVDEGLSGKNTNRPAFQRMVQDVEIGRIDTVMFTELSRLSRSLKDFLNIFEFAQKHQCDLICLKTDIDTTSPYKALITKILMIFAEFEREMTSQRTSANAYERSKRGLANGGMAPLGYRRDKKRKGYLLIDSKERKIIEDIFTTYLTEDSIKRTTELIRSRHSESTPRVPNLTRSMVHTIITNKAYIGVREINKHNGAPSEEVDAVWKPIIDEETFNRVQKALQANRIRYHARSDKERYLYLFSGLLRCGACGQKLQGKSAWSTSGTRHRYYSHHSSCPTGGHNRIRADNLHDLVLGWLRNIANNGEHFEKLRGEGKQRIQRRIEELRRAVTETESELQRLTDQIDARIDTMTKATSDSVRQTIEESIDRFSALQEEKRQLQAFTEQEIDRLETLKQDPAAYDEYQQRITELLQIVDTESSATPHDKRVAVRKLIASLVLKETEIKVALSGVNRKGPVSTVSCFAPPVGLKANGNLALIQDSIPLPGRLLLRSRSYLRRLYERERLSARAIAKRLNVSHSTVLTALASVGLNGHNGDGKHHNGHRKIKGQIPFGFVAVDNRLVKSDEEQKVIRLARQLRGNGLSLRKIAEELNRRLIATKNNGIWQANTVKKILDRVAEKR